MFNFASSSKWLKIKLDFWNEKLCNKKTKLDFPLHKFFRLSNMESPTRFYRLKMVNKKNRFKTTKTSNIVEIEDYLSPEKKSTKLKKTFLSLD